MRNMIRLTPMLKNRIIEKNNSLKLSQSISFVFHRFSSRQVTRMQEKLFTLIEFY